MKTFLFAQLVLMLLTSHENIISMQHAVATKFLSKRAYCSSVNLNNKMSTEIRNVPQENSQKKNTEKTQEAYILSSKDFHQNTKAFYVWDKK